MVGFGVFNAAAYCCLLPLWEGFDEAYHYGYVQAVSTQHRFPVLGETALSREIWGAFEHAPVSHYLQPFTHAPVNFGRYFAMSAEERAALRQQLFNLPAGAKYEPQTDKLNYEVNQSPLVYLLLAPVDWALSSLPLPWRILALRLLLSTLAIFFIAHATQLLARELALPGLFECGALLCVFSSQMLYATICHVCNDALAVPLLTYLMWAAIRVWRSASPRASLLLGAVLSTALLTKAYYLFVAPLPFALIACMLWRRRIALSAGAWFLLPVGLFAGPWFARNVWLYDNLTGTVEQTAGVNVQSFLHAVFRVPWPRSIVDMAHASLWTGNNSFLTFSSRTLDTVFLLLAAGVAFNFVFAHLRDSEWILIAAVGLYSAGLALSTVAFFISSNGGVTYAFPWYMQLLLPPVLLFAFLGMHRAGRWGRVLYGCTVALWVYVLAATYLEKLLPVYTGFPPGRVRLADLWTWYDTGAAAWTAVLAPPALVWTLIALTILTAFALAAILIRRIA